MFQKDKGCPLFDDKKECLCLLQWWKSNDIKYPLLWMLAERILAIPVTSAPAEHVFSIASGVINKKRARLAPHNVELLMFLHGSKALVNWHNDDDED
jgi:hypothetical protein